LPSIYRFWIVRVAFLVTPPYEALIVTAVFDLTGVVVISKVAELLPAGTVTVAGTRALAGLLLTRVTTTPVCGAGSFRRTVPVVVRPPITVGDFNVNDESAT